MKKTILTIFILICTTISFACSCPSIKIINAYSNFDFMGTVQFKSLMVIEKSSGYFESKIEIKELFKGDDKSKLFIYSDKGSSCEFIPELNTDYFILGLKNMSGEIEISFCSANSIPNEEKLSILRELVKESHSINISSNLIQQVKGDINPKFFKKSKCGFYLYKVLLNVDLSIKKILPLNENARMHQNDEVMDDLKSKVYYIKTDDKSKLDNSILTSFIILGWSENGKKEKIIRPTSL